MIRWRSRAFRRVATENFVKSNLVNSIEINRLFRWEWETGASLGEERRAWRGEEMFRARGTKRFCVRKKWERAGMESKDFNFSCWGYINEFIYWLDWKLHVWANQIWTFFIDQSNRFKFKFHRNSSVPCVISASHRSNTDNQKRSRNLIMEGITMNNFDVS
jgi:hypothetical protein